MILKDQEFIFWISDTDFIETLPYKKVGIEFPFNQWTAPNWKHAFYTGKKLQRRQEGTSANSFNPLISCSSTERITYAKILLCCIRLRLPPTRRVRALLWWKFFFLLFLFIASWAKKTKGPKLHQARSPCGLMMMQRAMKDDDKSTFEWKILFFCLDDMNACMQREAAPAMRRRCDDMWQWCGETWRSCVFHHRHHNIGGGAQDEQNMAKILSNTFHIVSNTMRRQNRIILFTA